MAEFNPAGGSGNLVGGIALGGDGTGNAEMDTVKVGVSDSDLIGAESKHGQGTFTICMQQIGTISHVTDASGQVMAHLSTTLDPGTVIFIGGDEPVIAGTHIVISSDSGEHLLDMAWESCMTSLDTSGEGDLPAPVYVTCGNTENNIVAQGHSPHLCGNTLVTDGCNPWNSYTSVVYTNCFACFSVGKCDMTSTVVELWDDHAACNPSVTYNTGGLVLSDNHAPGENGDQGGE